MLSTCIALVLATNLKMGGLACLHTCDCHYTCLGFLYQSLVQEITGSLNRRPNTHKRMGAEILAPALSLTALLPLVGSLAPPGLPGRQRQDHDCGQRVPLSPECL
jgi:hypothetical protein